MFKPCPQCGFLVALSPGREASQRCPRCGSVLLTDGELQAIEDAPAPPAPAGVAPTVEPDAPQGTATIAPAPIADPPGPAAIETAGTPPSDAVASIDDAPHDGPSFARRRVRARHRGPRWPWWAAVGGLALLLALQLLLAQRVALARDAAWRPLVLRACGVLRCDVPAWHEPQAYAMLARGVRPSRPGVLHVTATVRNDARWPQAAPGVVLSLADVDGRVVGARAVPPADYGHRADAPIAPGDTLDIAFDVREPGAHVESFDFQLQ
ncbi:DUF3426 domain-containing protein [Cognatilysobacter segetis]|uniref:DUF3426 domain-containing protein n=1 Tax=Cognatilysobacter segetis TaxID=2492394 RepID=UPI00105B6983|nr:DUF3426 domain-containing protein [Lysobacter segetis]